MDLSKLNIKSFVFMDLETTGLPLYESNKTRITEMCLSAVQKDHIYLGVFPRVQNTLKLCFNPRKLIDAQAEKVTGLSNFLLEKQSEFQQHAYELLLKYLDINQKPICFVAHNGYNFDYPILKAEVAKLNRTLPDDLLCIDSYEVFKYLLTNNEDNTSTNEMSTSSECASPSCFVKNAHVNIKLEDNLIETTSKVEDIQNVIEKTPNPKIRQPTNENVSLLFAPKKVKCEVSSVEPTDTGAKRKLFPQQKSTEKYDMGFKLGNIYYYLKREYPKNTHTADGDVNILIEISAIFGERFVNYAESHAKLLKDIPKMERGKRIGT